MAPARRRTSRPASARSRRRSRRPRPTMTARSCRSGWPSSRAAGRWAAAAAPPGAEGRRRKTGAEDASTAPAPPPRKRQVRAWAGRLSAEREVGKISDGNADVQAGINIVLKALESPTRQIAENSGVEGSIVVGKIMEHKSETFGFDAQSEEYVDLVDSGIVDPAK